MFYSTLYLSSLDFISFRYTVNSFEWLIASMGITPFTPLLWVNPTTLRNCLLAFWASDSTFRNRKVLPSSRTLNSSTCHGLRPRHLCIRYPFLSLCVNLKNTLSFAYTSSDFWQMKTLVRCDVEFYGAQHLHAFTLWLTDCPYYSFMLFVTS